MWLWFYFIIMIVMSPCYANLHVAFRSLMILTLYITVTTSRIQTSRIVLWPVTCDGF